MNSKKSSHVRRFLMYRASIAWPSRTRLSEKSSIHLIKTHLHRLCSIIVSFFFFFALFGIEHITNKQLYQKQNFPPDDSADMRVAQAMNLRARN